MSVSADRDDTDLRLAADELAAGRALLFDAHQAATPARGEAIRSALARLALASRFIDDVVDRRGGICGDVDNGAEGT